MTEGTSARERFEEARYKPECYREYQNEKIRVTWEADLCIHYGACTRFLPAVFRPAERPWVDVDAATADELADIVRRCPTGALHYERLDGEKQEQPEDPMVVCVQKGGPLFLRGEIHMKDHRGNTIRDDTRVALCRCGRSNNKPFCDGTHDTFLFR
ncbi:MAG: (4Fe-4S)-binding protein [Actinomycetota bacterium]